MELPSELKHRMFFDEKELPKIFGAGFSRQQMRLHRLNGTGPRWIMVGRLRKYLATEIIRWVEAQNT